jgi:hypothetical protein
LSRHGPNFLFGNVRLNLAVERLPVGRNECATSGLPR